jgi:hypothetical protein
VTPVGTLNVPLDVNVCTTGDLTVIVNDLSSVSLSSSVALTVKL